MSCFCPVPLNGLMASLARLPSFAGMVPPVSTGLSMALAPGTGSHPALASSAGASSSAFSSAQATAAAAANLSAMAAVSAAFKTALGMDFATALSAQASAGVSARLASAIDGFNANVGALTFDPSSVARLLVDLSGLVRLSGLVLAIRAATGIDMRAAGAVSALGTRLAAMARARAAASAAATVAASGSAVATAMAAMGLKVDAHGSLTANAQAQALAALAAAQPAIGAGFPMLAMLNALFSMLEAVRAGLGVDLRAPTAAADLRRALSALPVNALAALSAQASAPAAASAAASAGGAATLAAAAGASVSANAAAALDLKAVARADLSAAARIGMLLDTMAKGGLGVPAGDCGRPCPLAPLKDAPLPSPALSAGGSAGVSARAG